jgi:hypothetical protein
MYSIIKNKVHKYLYLFILIHIKFNIIYYLKTKWK